MLPSFLPAKPSAGNSTSVNPALNQPTGYHNQERTAATSSSIPHQAYHLQAAPMMMTPGAAQHFASGYAYPQPVTIPFHQAQQSVLRQALFQPPVYHSASQNEAGHAYSSAYIAERALQSASSGSMSSASSNTISTDPAVSSETITSERARPGRNGYPSFTDPTHTRDRPPSASGPPFKKPRPPLPTPNFAPPRGAPNSSHVGAGGRGGGAWRNCAEPGCAFLGPDEEVEVHEEDRHLIFKEGRKVIRSEEEEEMAQLRKAGIPPPPIQGTSITLRTEEDIAKWIAQRKARFPTAARIADKERERRERMERGEPDAYGTARGRGNNRGRGRGMAAGLSVGDCRGGAGAQGGLDRVQPGEAGPGHDARAEEIVLRGRPRPDGFFGNLEWVRPGLLPQQASLPIEADQDVEDGMPLDQRGPVRGSSTVIPLPPNTNPSWREIKSGMFTNEAGPTIPVLTTPRIKQGQATDALWDDTSDGSDDEDGGEKIKINDGPEEEDLMTLERLRSLMPDYGSDEDEDDNGHGSEAERMSGILDGSEGHPRPNAVETLPIISARSAAGVLRTTATNGNSAELGAEQAGASDEREICRFFARTGRCAHGDDCYYRHVRPERRPRDPEVQQQKKEQKKLEKAKQVKEPKQVKAIGAFQKQVSRPSLLGALLQQPISATLSHLTQAIQFLVENDFLDNVELMPGQAEEELRKRRKVIEVRERGEGDGDGEEECEAGEGPPE